MNRRNFLKTGAAATSFMILPRWAAGQGTSPNSKINIAIIGCGGRGRNHVDGYKDENIVAMCDVDDDRAAVSFEKYPNVPKFKDYRVMFDKMGDKFDAVSIATPDHMHYPIALWALMMGKHVYCEKPLVRTVWEARQLKAAAAKAGVVTQMGNQGHTFEGLRYIKEWTQAGIIGDVKEVFHWSNRPVWPQGALVRADEKVPATLDYDLWLGVAPKKSYDSAIVPFKWRGWKDYGCGAVGDMACHIMDSSFSGLGLGLPSTVSAKGAAVHEETYPESESIVYQFPRKGGGRPIKVTWSDGGEMPNLKKIKGVDPEFFAETVDNKGRTRMKNDNGTFIVGKKGVIWTDTYSSTVRVFPDDYFKELRSSKALPPKTLDRVKGGPFSEFTDAIRDGVKAGSDFSYAADFTETALLGLVSLESGRKIRYDGEKGVIKGNRKASKYLESRYDYNEEFLPA